MILSIISSLNDIVRFALALFFLFPKIFGLTINIMTSLAHLKFLTRWSFLLYVVGTYVWSNK